MSCYDSGANDNRAMTTLNPPTHSRRAVLGKSAVLLAGLASGVKLVDLAMAATKLEATDQLVRWGMLVDVTRCADGCTDCVDACNTEHGLNSKGRPLTDAQYIRVVKLKDKSTGHTSSLPVMCQHCETAPCVDVCPTGASFRREDGVCWWINTHVLAAAIACWPAPTKRVRSFMKISPLRCRRPPVAKERSSPAISAPIGWIAVSPLPVSKPVPTMGTRRWCSVT